jgi:Beta-ketoacyl synthase, N-terminal domain
VNWLFENSPSERLHCLLINIGLANNFNMSSSTSVCGETPFTPASLAVSESSLESFNETTLDRTIRDPTVIVGMACRTPGATNTSQLWNVIAEKKDLQRKIPEDRFNVDAFYHPQGSNKGTVNRIVSNLL